MSDTVLTVGETVGFDFSAASALVDLFFNSDAATLCASSIIFKNSDSAIIAVPNFLAASIFELCSSVEIR